MTDGARDLNVVDIYQNNKSAQNYDNNRKISLLIMIEFCIVQFFE